MGCHSFCIFITGAFLYARYSFLLISNKFCDLSLRGFGPENLDLKTISTEVKKSAHKQKYEDSF